MFLQQIKIGIATLLIFFSTVAIAHRFHAGITDISVNPKTGNIEIVHTFMTHDVEGLLENLYQREFDLSDEEDALLFRRYVEKQFSISSFNKQSLPVQWIGLKVDQNSVVVFQEIVKQDLPNHAVIKNAVLTDFLPDQINTINVNTKGKIQTLILSRSQREQSID